MKTTVDNWLDMHSKQLRKVGINSARLDCFVLLEHVLAKDRTWLIAHMEFTLEDHHLNRLNTLVAQRFKHTPLAYIVGSKEFYGREFLVNNDVLIPRPESEAIIELLMRFSETHEINTVIDIGTGSGCLAITAALLLPKTHITASDISPDALKVARRNARTYSVQIRFHVSDLLTDLPGMPSTRHYVILANLPYVPADLITSPEITREPGLALFSDRDGLNHYRRFWQQITGRKNKPFAIITESLSTQHQKMSSLARKSGYQLQTTKDLVQLYTLN